MGTAPAMPTRPKKGSTPHQDTTGESTSGGQKATQGSAVSPEVAEARMEAEGLRDDREDVEG